ncbi:hypothetical protein AWC17_03215 [Mycobacterium nebraskense]|uniref:Uncharacterized protein n=1 Tax=Mycobacterium nebraskense TaxID=244292 RepID=A0A1X1ZMH7_9MYCO|nr:hypothetical protein [Mycobacterium nebraskense]ORW24566.1 hypothetical protein AWC17_03215 [Mycobacterium nebraskense]
MVACAFAAYTVVWALGAMVKHGTAGWCREITSAGADPGYGLLLDIASGPQEEVTFTGVALLLLAGRGWAVQCSAVAISAAARGVLHLYYADHHTVWIWMAWAATWSGGGLLFAFLVDHSARATGMGHRRFTAVYTSGIVAAHSLMNMSWIVVYLAVVAGAFVAVLIDRLRHEFWWLASGFPRFTSNGTRRQRSPRDPQPK